MGTILAAIDAALNGAEPRDRVLDELDPPPGSGRQKPAPRFGVTPEVLSMVAARVRVPKADAAELRRLDDAWATQFDELARFAALTPEGLAAQAAEQASADIIAGRAPTEPILDPGGWAGRRESLVVSRKLALKSLANAALSVAKPHLEDGARAARELIVHVAREESERARKFGLPFTPTACEPLLLLQAVADAFTERASRKPGSATRPATLFAGLLQ